jgi:hypothetical protein
MTSQLITYTSHINHDFTYKSSQTIMPLNLSYPKYIYTNVIYIKKIK